MREIWVELRLAASFLTRFPVGPRDMVPDRTLARSMAWFPLVGLGVGALLVGADQLLLRFWPPALANALLLTLLIGVSGALHLDGVADVADGLYGGRDREGVLRIMKDSRVGAMGVIAVVVLLLLKYQGLCALPAAARWQTLLLLPAAGRWLPTVLAASCAYARPGGGTGAPFVAATGWREGLLATVTLVAAAVVLTGAAAAVILPLLGLLALLAARYFQARLGGVTGDVLGAAVEVAEVLLLLMVVALGKELS